MRAIMKLDRWQSRDRERAPYNRCAAGVRDHEQQHIARKSQVDSSPLTHAQTDAASRVLLEQCSSFEHTRVFPSHLLRRLHVLGPKSGGSKRAAHSRRRAWACVLMYDTVMPLIVESLVVATANDVERHVSLDLAARSLK